MPTKYVPVAHGVHSRDPSAVATYPVLEVSVQMSVVQLQERHDPALVCPCLVEYLPASHRMHLDAPVA